MFPGNNSLGRNFNTLQYLIHAPNFIRLFWRLFNDKRVGMLPRVLLVIGVLYFVSPLDLLPDFPLVGLGWMDDFFVLYMMAKAFIRLCPKQVVAEHVSLINQGA